MSFYGFARVLVKSFYHIAFRIKIEGLENLPKDGAYVVCANHQSNLDPPLLGVCLPIRLRFMAKEELFSNKLFGSLLKSLGAFPIKRGKSDVGALRAAMKMLASGEKVVVFPEGGRSPQGHLRKGKSGAALIAVKSGVNILPIGIDGKYRLFSKITVRIGKVIPLEKYFDEKVESETLQMITDTDIMPTISQLSGVCTYENRDCR